MLEIDGSYLEGGGQIIRTALALSTITGIGFRAKDIRKGRKEPGLKSQHLYCIKGLQELCNAEVTGAEIGSEEITYNPGKIEPKRITIDIGTAGSITLLLQSLIMPCALSGKEMRLKIIGGTDTEWSPLWDYFARVILPHLKKYADIKAKLERRGYYPKGGGKADIRIIPKYNIDNLNEAPGIELVKQGELVKIEGVVNCSKELAERKVGERIGQCAKLCLGRINAAKEIRVEYADTLSIGCGIVLAARFSSGDEIKDEFNPVILGADALGEKGKTAEKVGEEAAKKLLGEISSKAAVDEHLADNLIPYLGLFGGAIKASKITEHTKTNIYVTEKFLGKRFEVDEENGIIKRI